MQNIKHIEDKRFEKDTEGILKLSDKVFGEGFINKDEVYNYINTPESLVIVYENYENIIGFILGAPLNYISSELEYDDKFKREIEIIYYLKSIIVDPDYQGTGVGSSLFEEMKKNIKNYGKILMHIWYDSPNNSSYNFFKSKGGQEIKTYPNKWYQESIQEGWTCSTCGNPCYCSSIEMVIEN